MKLKIVIVDLEVPPRLKRWVLRIGIPAVVAAVGAVALATPPTPHSWATNDVLNATDLNGNFTNLTNYAGGLENRIASLEAFRTQATADGGYSVGARYCGASVNTNGQITNGYAGARALCEAVTGCSPSTAHMCTSEEVVRSLALGLPAWGGWVATGTWSQAPNPLNIEDCAGFTQSSMCGAVPCYGTVIANTGAGSGTPSTSACSTSQPVLCCD